MTTPYKPRRGTKRLFDFDSSVDETSNGPETDEPAPIPLSKIPPVTLKCMRLKSSLHKKQRSGSAHVGVDSNPSFDGDENDVDLDAEENYTTRTGSESKNRSELDIVNRRDSSRVSASQTLFQHPCFMWVNGESGSGKTTLVERIVTQWTYLAGKTHRFNKNISGNILNRIYIVSENDEWKDFLVKYSSKRSDFGQPGEENPLKFGCGLYIISTYKSVEDCLRQTIHDIEHDFKDANKCLIIEDCQQETKTLELIKRLINVTVHHSNCSVFVNTHGLLNPKYQFYMRSQTKIWLGKCGNSSDLSRLLYQNQGEIIDAIPLTKRLEDRMTARPKIFCDELARTLINCLPKFSGIVMRASAEGGHFSMVQAESDRSSVKYTPSLYEYLTTERAGLFVKVLEEAVFMKTSTTCKSMWDRNTAINNYVPPWALERSDIAESVGVTNDGIDSPLDRPDRPPTTASKSEAKLPSTTDKHEEPLEDRSGAVDSKSKSPQEPNDVSLTQSSHGVGHPQLSSTTTQVLLSHALELIKAATLSSNPQPKHRLETTNDTST